jgi:hypothetical protein
MSYIIIIILAVLLFPVLVGAVSSFLTEEKINKIAERLDKKLGNRFPKS